MTPTPEQIAAIAKGLTKAQRKAVLRARRFAGHMDLTCSTSTMRVLARVGVALMKGDAWASLTPLGLLVRSYLAEPADTPRTEGKSPGRDERHRQDSPGTPHPRSN